MYKLRNTSSLLIANLRQVKNKCREISTCVDIDHATQVGFFSFNLNKNKYACTCKPMYYTVMIFVKLIEDHFNFGWFMFRSMIWTKISLSSIKFYHIYYRVYFILTITSTALCKHTVCNSTAVKATPLHRKSPISFKNSIFS